MNNEIISTQSGDAVKTGRALQHVIRGTAQYGIAQDIQAIAVQLELALAYQLSQCCRGAAPRCQTRERAQGVLTEDQSQEGGCTGCTAIGVDGDNNVRAIFLHADIPVLQQKVCQRCRIGDVLEVGEHILKTQHITQRVARLHLEVLHHILSAHVIRSVNQQFTGVGRSTQHNLVVACSGANRRTRQDIQDVIATDVQSQRDQRIGTDTVCTVDCRGDACIDIQGAAGQQMDVVGRGHDGQVFLDTRGAADDFAAQHNAIGTDQFQNAVGFQSGHPGQVHLHTHTIGQFLRRDGAVLGYSHCAGGHIG